jgi:MMPL family protein/putative sensor protein
MAWFAPLASPRTYLSILYLSTRFLPGIFYVVVLSVGLAGAAGSTVLLGLPLLVGTLALLWCCAKFERDITAWWLGVELPPMRPPPAEGQPSLPGQVLAGWLRRLRDHLGLSVTWKSMVYLLLQLPMGLIAFLLLAAVLALPLALVAAPAFYVADALTFSGRPGSFQGPLLWVTGSSGHLDAFGLAVTALLFVVGGLLLAGAVALVNRAAGAWGALARSMLSASEAELQVGEARRAATRETSQLLVVVLFGVGTDYILFLLFRFRERLRAGEAPRQAMVSAVTRVGQVIASAAGVVIVAFLTLALSTFGGFRSLGPSLAIAVAVTLVSALALVPAVVSLLGTRVFWPSRAWRWEPSGARFAALGWLVGRRTPVVAAASGLAMAALALGAARYVPSFDQNSGLPSGAESQIALQSLERGLPAGATQPADVLLRSDRGRLDPAELSRYGSRLQAVSGVGQVAPPRLSTDGTTADFTVLLRDDPSSTRWPRCAGCGARPTRLCPPAPPRWSGA